MRLPSAPILAVLDRAAIAQGYIGRDRAVGDTEAAGLPAFCQAIGIHPKTIERLRKAGTITVELADHLAIALGLHPIIVWGAEQWEVPFPDDDEAADEAARRLRARREHFNAASRKTYAKQRGAA